VDRETVEARVALVTGGANGIGAAVSRRLASRGLSVVVADRDLSAAEAVAAEIGGIAVRCDVASLEDNVAAVEATVQTYGGLDIAVLNAGVASGCSVGDDFDLTLYRRVMGANLDGVVLGLHAVEPALRARGGGDVVATASMAALTVVPEEPLYAASKAAVSALIRSVAPTWAKVGIRVNAVCPSFTDTAIIADFRSVITQLRMPLLEADDVADAFEQVLASGRTGESWMVVPGRDIEPYRFSGVPGPRG
jgi:NAD(P)-dependent dehydrogenase (short-subunit alcohol dehydrogenase family)